MKKRSLGSKIKLARESKGWSQTTLATKAGISLPTVWNAENGKHIPHPFTLAAIAKSLGVKVEELQA